MNLFDRFHAAFDVAPPAGGFDRLRRELSRPAADRRSRPANRMRWSRMGLRLAAVAAVAVIAIALVAAYLAGQHGLIGYMPAGSSGSVAAYQTMVQADHHAFTLGPFDCATVSGPSCSSDVAANGAAMQKWLDDLKRFNTPLQFAVVDAQMRMHLTDMLRKIDAAAAALNAQDQTAFDSAVKYGRADVDWLDQVTNGISQSRAITATEYTDLLAAENQILFGSSGGPDTTACTSVDDALCASELTAAAQGVSLIMADFARNIPPSSLTDRASTLERDVAEADNAYLRMNNALFQKDLGALKAGNAAAQDAWVAIAADLQS